jgi:hypothetical protein
VAAAFEDWRRAFVGLSVAKKISPLIAFYFLPMSLSKSTSFDPRDAPAVRAPHVLLHPAALSFASALEPHDEGCPDVAWESVSPFTAGAVLGAGRAYSTPTASASDDRRAVRASCSNRPEIAFRSATTQARQGGHRALRFGLRHRRCRRARVVRSTQDALSRPFSSQVLGETGMHRGAGQSTLEQRGPTAVGISSAGW